MNNNIKLSKLNIAHEKEILWFFPKHYLNLKNWFAEHIWKSFMFPTILYFTNNGIQLFLLLQL